MDNDGYSQDPEKGTELSLVEKSPTTVPGDIKKPTKFTSHRHDNNSAKQNDNKETQPSRNPNTDQGANNAQTSASAGGGGGSGGQQPEPGPSTSCRPEVCQRARERYTAPDLRGSPWHRNKTIFLLITIGSLIIWAIVYSILTKLDIV